MVRVLIGLLLTLALVTVAALLVLPHAAPRLLVWQLRSLGLDEGAVGEVEVGARAIVLDEVRLAEGLSARRVSVTYAPFELIRGRLGELQVTGLRARLHHDPAGGPAIPGLELGGGGTGGPALPLLPERVRIEDAVLEVALPDGALVLEGEARLEVVADGADRFVVQARRITAETAGGSVTGSLRLAGELELLAADPLTTLQATGTATVQASGLELTEVDLAALDASLDLALDGAVLAVGIDNAGARIARAGPDDPLTALGGTWPVEITVEGPREKALVLDLRQRSARLSTALQLSAGGPSGDLALDLAAAAPGPIEGARFEDLAVRLEVRDLGPGPRLDRLRLDLAGQGSWNEATLEGTLAALGGGTLEGVGEARLELAAPLTIGIAPDKVSVALGAPGSLLLSELSVLEAVDRGRARLTLAEGPVLELDRSEIPGWRLSVPVRIEELEVEATDRSVRGGSGRLEIRAAGRGADPETLEVRLTDGALRLPEAEVALGGLAAQVSLRPGATPGPVAFQIGTVRSLASPPLFAAVSADGVVRPEPEQVRFESTLARAGLQLRIEGHQRLDRPGGRAQVDLQPVRFAPGELQPGDLVPALAGLVEQAVGELSLAGVVRLDRPELASDLGLIVEDLGFVLGPVRVEGMRGVVAIEQLLPPATAPEQMLSIGLVDFGLTFSRGRARFELLPGGPLDMRRLTFAWAGGEVAARPFTVGSADGVISLTLEARGLDLGQIFAEVRLPGLEGQGTIDGVLPVRIAGGEASIENGRLAARRAGWLRYRPEDPPDALAAGGESMTLLLQALEDFRYDELEITLDGRTDRAMDIRLHLKGANPELYGGHPVEFNLNLEGELANILRQGLKSYTLPERVREQIERSRSR